MNSSHAIEKFNFRDDVLDVVRDGEQLFVSVRRVCEALGVQPHGQAEKLKTKPWAVTQLICATGPDGKSYETFCINLDSLPMWLATIDASRVSPELAPKLIAYQRDAARALRDFFYGPRITLATQPVATSPGAERMMLALTEQAKSVASLAAAMSKIVERLAALEARSENPGLLSPERASAIKARVRFCARSLSQLGIEKVRKASFRMHRRLKLVAHWSGDFCRLDNMPARHEAEVMRELEIIEHETNGVVAQARQLRLPIMSDLARKPRAASN